MTRELPGSWTSGGFESVQQAQWSKSQANSPWAKDARDGPRQSTEAEAPRAYPGTKRCIGPALAASFPSHHGDGTPYVTRVSTAALDDIKACQRMEYRRDRQLSGKSAFWHKVIESCSALWDRLLAVSICEMLVKLLIYY